MNYWITSCSLLAQPADISRAITFTICQKRVKWPHIVFHAAQVMEEIQQALEWIWIKWIMTILMNVSTEWLNLNEVGARSYEYTGRSNAAWVRVKKRFTGIWPVEGYWRFHRPLGWHESSIPFHSRTKACEPFHYANPGCVGSPGCIHNSGHLLHYIFLQNQR